MPPPRFYSEFADWWPLFSPPSHYAPEAADLLPRLGSLPSDRRPTLLELGAGGGSLASHLSDQFELTLTDLSPDMLAVSRRVNPGAQHLQGDMRSLRLGRQFDVVLVHDAIMYAVEPEDVEATLHTARAHCRADGVVAVLPDFVQETFLPGDDCGGHDGPDGRAFRYLEWRWDPDPTDSRYTVDYAFVLRDADGSVRVEHDRHVEGVFSIGQWHDWFAAAGLSVTSSRDPWNRDVLIGRP